ncbi:MAG: hypothetical protein ABFD92_07585 [Planctomycetaceae bacterium]|nr:hypothetical protein [Planctomycetaceae bacterium]
MPLLDNSAGYQVLSAASPSGEATVSLMIWGAVLVALMLGLGLLIVLAKKKYQQSRQKPDGSEHGFDIDTVEAYYQSGKISKEEFALLRTRALGLDKKAGSKAKSSSSPPSGGDDES